MNAPLYESLSALAETRPLRLHMPGHKGRGGGVFSAVSALDFTELSPVGTLYTGEGPIAEAEALYARFSGARESLFFSCGSTQGVYTMLAAAAGQGGTLILERGCHRSVYQGMALLDITPVYLTPSALDDSPLPAPVDPAELDAALTAHPEARAVFLTSPSYYGVITPLAPLAEICRRHGVYLLVDQAHGAHFPAVGLLSATAEGADLAVVSAHKTLPALGSSAVLLVGDRAPWDRIALKSISAVFGTTSPSWPILASIDYARARLEDEDGPRYRDVARAVSLLREKINRETPFRALTETAAISLDPCRLTIDTAAGGLSGQEADALLQKQNIYVEMADETYLVAILTCADTQADLDRFFSALKNLPAGPPGVEASAPLPALPPVRLSIREALFGPAEPLPLQAAAGRISARILAPYPPGIPILAPGEEITEKHIAYLQKKRYNIKEDVWVVRKCPTCDRPCPHYEGGT